MFLTIILKFETFLQHAVTSKQSVTWLKRLLSIFVDPFITSNVKLNPENDIVRVRAGWQTDARCATWRGLVPVCTRTLMRKHVIIMPSLNYFSFSSPSFPPLHPVYSLTSNSTLYTQTRCAKRRNPPALAHTWSLFTLYKATAVIAILKPSPRHWKHSENGITVNLRLFEKWSAKFVSRYRQIKNRLACFSFESAFEILV